MVCDSTNATVQALPRSEGQLFAGLLECVQRAAAGCDVVIHLVGILGEGLSGRRKVQIAPGRVDEGQTAECGTTHVLLVPSPQMSSRWRKGLRGVASTVATFEAKIPTRSFRTEPMPSRITSAGLPMLERGATPGVAK